MKCQLKAKSGPPNVVKATSSLGVDPSATSGHPWLAERRKGDLVVKCHGREVSVEGKSGILGLRNVVKATWL